MNRKRYCEFLIATQTNRTQTYLADHTDDLAHDAVNRYLKGDRVRASEVWEAVQPQLERSAQGYLIFDDTVLDKNHARKMGLVRKQWSGNEKRAIRGIGLVTCVYVNPETQGFWVVDARIFAPEQDGKSKLEHVSDMLQRALERATTGELPFRCVLMDTWYAVNRLMVMIHRAKRFFCCPVKGNRNISDSPFDLPHPPDSKKRAYQRVDTLAWTDEQGEHGRMVHLRECPASFTVKLFRVALSTERTEWIVTNDPSLLDVNGVRSTHAVRWKVEQVHRELKQVTGVEECQCRDPRAQRNHIGCALLVWVRLTDLARQAHTTVYALKHSLLSDYMRRELRSPTLSFA